MMDVLVNTTVVIILEYVGVSIEHVVHLRVTQWYVCLLYLNKVAGNGRNLLSTKTFRSSVIKSGND